MNEIFRILIRISQKSVPKGSINNNSALVQVVAWWRSHYLNQCRPSSLKQICATRKRLIRKNHFNSTKVTSWVTLFLHIVHHHVWEWLKTQAWCSHMPFSFLIIVCKEATYTGMCHIKCAPVKFVIYCESANIWKHRKHSRLIYPAMWLPGVCWGLSDYSTGVNLW